MVTPLPLDRARRIVLAAQCFGASREQPPSGRRANHVIRRLAQFQIDSVNVFTRAQTMPLFSRLGAYSPAALEQGGLYEYWGHAASLIDVNLYPHFGFRRAEAGERPWAEIRQLMAEQPKLVDAVLAEVAARGPITAREISLGRSKNASGWWAWSDAKTVLEWL
ncbi:MAG: winged helix DNA-binding domain-containing protein, partial [Bifidobacteriaceae bacterium]|nr:winged helix DNA-binding domain-containing protein [Bifidobacteriaceae bacterium]